MTSRPRLAHSLLLAALVAATLAPSARADDSVILTARFTPGHQRYAETEAVAESKSTSPMGDFAFTLRSKTGVVEKVEPAEDGATLSLTTDRTAFTFDSSMGPSFYDSDVPDEEQSQEWEKILSPQIGMAARVTLDAKNNAVAYTGMEAIVAKIDKSAAGSMFWSEMKNEFTDDRRKQLWHNLTLSIFPNQPVRPGETWTAPYIEELAELKDFAFDCTYKLDRIAKKDGRRLAEISFQGRVPDGRQFESEGGMMPINNIKLEKAALSGTATIDLDRGQLLRREDHAEVAFNGTIGDGENAPKTTSTRTITRTYVIKSIKDRADEKQKNLELAAAKERELELAEAARRKRFASAKQIEVNTAMRENTVGVAASWPQWGGPHGDFKADCTGLADKWPEGGPKKLWSRDLGDGYSSIACDGKRLYTMYRPTDEEKNKTDELIIALDPKTGETLWEHIYEAQFVKGMDNRFGRGPHSTPLIVGDRLFAVGSLVNLHCLDSEHGSVLWSRDLRKDEGASHMMYGYGASALAYKDTIILPIGGEGKAVIAFRQSDGSVAWKNQDFGPTHASPFIANVGGEDQLILFADKAVAGLDPASGKLKWTHEHPTQFGANISTPVWGEDETLFISSAYGMGSRGILLQRSGGATEPKELWHNRKMKIHHGNAVRVGNFVYGSSGDFGPVFYAAVDVKSGEFAWKNRDVGKASSLYADGKMIILNEKGRLFLARPSPAELEILSEAQLCEDRTWTTPTLVGKTLFVRDRQKIMALDLG